MTDLASRLERLEHIEALRRLKHYTYCRCVDRLVAGDICARKEISAHLANGVAADFTGFELFEGKAAVEDFLFRHVPSVLSYSQHRVMNEVIEIDGNTAHALWYLDCPVVFRAGNGLDIEGSALIAGRYEEDYVCENGVWKWRRITALLDTVQDLEKNWGAAVQIERNR